MMLLGTLNYIPFLEPIQAVHEYWYLLLLPLAFGISVIYKAMRMQKLHKFWRHVGFMTAQIVLAMIALSIGLVILIQVVLPMLPVD